jgi:hypothetical protein
MSVPSIILDPDELEVSHLIGEFRHNNCVQHGYTNYKKSTIHPDDITLDILGVLGEVVVAKYFNCLQEYIDDNVDRNVGWTLKDVGHVQVRLTPVLHGCLIIRPGYGRCKDGEKLEEPFILVIQKTNLEYLIPGWLFGKEGLKDEWKRNPYDKGEAYFIPQNKLRSIETLNKEFLK